MRSKLQDFKLDKHGFRVVVENEIDPNALLNSIRYEDYDDEKILRGQMRPAVESFLKRMVPGAEDAIAFSHQVRKRSHAFPTLPRGTDAQVPQPVQGVHVGELCFNFSRECLFNIHGRYDSRFRESRNL